MGGYKTEDGRTVKWGKIYRSDNLHSLTDEDLKYMKRLNIKSVVDFRSLEKVSLIDLTDMTSTSSYKFSTKELDDDSIKNIIKDLTFGDSDSSNLLRDFNINC